MEKNFTLPELILWTGTRVALGAGIGMLISRRLGRDEGSWIRSGNRRSVHHNSAGDLRHG